MSFPNYNCPPVFPCTLDRPMTSVTGGMLIPCNPIPRPPTQDIKKRKNKTVKASVKLPSNELISTVQETRPADEKLPSEQSGAIATSKDAFKDAEPSTSGDSQILTQNISLFVATDKITALTETSEATNVNALASEGFLSKKKRHSCETCGKDYARQDKLTQHIRSHTGDRPFRCSHCPRSFIRKDKCVIHERIHTGEKPYKCALCDKAFIRSDKRSQHTARVHLKVPSLSHFNSYSQM